MTGTCWKFNPKCLLAGMHFEEGMVFCGYDKGDHKKHVSGGRHIDDIDKCPCGYEIIQKTQNKGF